MEPPLNDRGEPGGREQQREEQTLWAVKGSPETDEERRSTQPLRRNLKNGLKDSTERSTSPKRTSLLGVQVIVGKDKTLYTLVYTFPFWYSTKV